MATDVHVGKARGVVANEEREDLAHDLPQLHVRTHNGGIAEVDGRYTPSMYLLPQTTEGRGSNECRRSTEHSRTPTSKFSKAYSFSIVTSRSDDCSSVDSSAAVAGLGALST